MPTQRYVSQARINLLRKLDFGERVFAVVGLLFFSGSLDLLLSYGRILTLIRHGSFVLASCLLILRWRRTASTLLGDLFLLTVMGLTFFSFGWSENPLLSLGRARGVLQTGAFGIYLATRFNVKEQLQLICWALGIGAAISAIYALGVPTEGIHVGAHDGAWRGIYGHKNNLGGIMSFASIAFLVLSLATQRHRYWVWAGFGLVFGLLILSTSKTALAVFLGAAIVLSFCYLLRWRGLIGSFAITSFVSIAGVAATIIGKNLESVLASAGRDLTLTGRTQVWIGAIEKVLDRPWLGYGRDVFWDLSSGYAFEIGLNVGEGYLPPHAHNGFLDMALEIGLIGLLCFLPSFGLAILRSVKRVSLTQTADDLWPLVFLSFLFFYNLTESYLIRGTTIFWVTYIAVALSVRKSKPMQTASSSPAPVCLSKPQPWIPQRSSEASRSSST